jgi:hypothetical protein
MSDCPLYDKEDGDKIEGKCGMVENGCPYAGRQEKAWKWETPEDLWKLQGWDRIYAFGMQNKVKT